MFEAAELGRKVDKQTFATEEPLLHTALLAAQRELQSARIPLIIVVSGVEGAGKGEVVNRLTEWFDSRGVRTHAFWDQTDEELERPRYWRFWRQLPPAGTIGILFGSWYTAPIVDHVFRRVGRASFARELQRIAEFEQLLVDDGALIVKFWFHLTKKDQQKRLRDDLESGRLSSPLLTKFAKRYTQFRTVCEQALRLTDSGACPWHLVEAADRRYRDLTVGQTLVRVLRQRFDAPPAAVAPTAPQPPAAPLITVAATPTQPTPARTVLDRVDLAAVLTESKYEKQLERFQRQLNQLAWQARQRQRHTIALFEGWDAAGKGSAIRRVTRAIDARLFQVISVAAPTDEERAQHYLWRFWRHLPRAGYMTIYDRSWYGRVLVERVEGLASETQWRRAYREINAFEEHLVEHGVVLLKFWLHISPEEQLRRFEERETLAWKRHKITAEDWRNREKWDAYAAAVDEMVARTSTAAAPWHLIAANDKKFARVEVLRTMCDRMAMALDRG